MGVAPTSTCCFFTRITLSCLWTCPVSSSLGAGIASYQSLDGSRGVTEPGFTHPPLEDVLQGVRCLCSFPRARPGPGLRVTPVSGPGQWGWLRPFSGSQAQVRSAVVTGVAEPPLSL